MRLVSRYFLAIVQAQSFPHFADLCRMTSRMRAAASAAGASQTTFAQPLFSGSGAGAADGEGEAGER